MRTGRRAAAGVVASALVLLTAMIGIPGARAATDTGWDVTRIGGADRYATAAALSRHTFPNRTVQVMVASGEQFADALAATPAASRLGAPLLLTGRDKVPAATMTELRRLRPSVILLAGGTTSVSFAVEQQLAGVARVARVAGTTRFETAAKLSSTAFGTGVPVVFLAQGGSFPDALAAGAAAGRLQGPVLLVEQNGIPKVVATELARLRPARIVLVGGKSAVSDAVGRSTGHRNVDRVAGKDRYSTAAALAAEVPTTRSKIALIASGTSFADALSAGPSASALGGTFALTGKECLPTASAQGMADDGVREVLIIGGERAVPDAAADPCEAVVPTTTTTAAPTTTTSTTTTTTVPRTGGGTTTTVPRSTTTTPAPVFDAVPKLTARGSLAEDAADPTILKVGNRWYAYATQVYLTKVPVRWSDDLRTWSRQSEAMPGLAPWAEFGAHWAPTVTQVGGRFVMWYSARDRASGRQCISRAVADRPEGPFVDDLRAAPVCQVALGGSIDPHVFTDRDGSRWLSWKSDENSVGVRSQLWTVPLSSDARTLAGTPVAILTQDAAWETFTIEQPALYRKGDVYYLFYSGGYWESDTYAEGYATGPSPRGPFTKQTVTAPWLASAADAAGPGALDIFTGPGNETWATYHAWAGGVGYVNGAKRTLRVAKLDL